jgi:16S rRNA (cytidine1402-2'-O)-methyltransferase
VIGEIAPNRKIVVARELTKKFEEICRGVSQELIEHWQDGTLKGEIVLLIAGEAPKTSEAWEHMNPAEHVEWMQSTYLMTRKEAIYAVAKIRNVSKRDVYNKVIA